MTGAGDYAFAIINSAPKLVLCMHAVGEKLRVKQSSNVPQPTDVRARKGVFSVRSSFSI